MRSRIRFSAIVLILVAILTVAIPAYACTSIPVEKAASADGSTMTAHTCDGWYDARTFVVPGKKHQPGDTFPCYSGLLHSDRKAPVKIGEIPEAEETYTYFYAAYPYMNEHQVIMGETTIGNRRELTSGEGLMFIETLQILGLQRAKTAREAVKVMGELAEKYGYIDSGECLTVGDPNEIWFFEVMPPGAFKKGAVWAAVRLPEGHVSVSANRSRIGAIDPKDTENFMASSNVFDLAIENGWWDPQSSDPFLFYKAYGFSNSQGSRRREWRVLSWAAPSLKLDSTAERYPFSVKAERPITVQDMMTIYRDTYTGTIYDKANVNDWYVPDGKGGFYKSPFATPDVSSEFAKLVDAPSERNISIPGCSYFTIIQARGWLPSAIGGLAWFGLNSTDTSVYVPVYAGVRNLPANYAVNDRTKFNLDNYKESAWWAFDFMDNLVNRRYQDMIKDLVAVRDPFEAEQFALQPAIEKTAAELYKTNPELAVSFLTQYTNSRCEKAVDLYWRTAEQLITKYDDKGF
ncbi:MAG: C69 family dipeptidase [Clostridia bacterium]|nr:C69 family dipeptidase [Clostridia bacterium]